MPLYRVRMFRRRDRPGRPWVLWWYDPPGEKRVRTLSVGPMSERLAERHRGAQQAELNGFHDDDGAAGGAVRWPAFVERYLASAAADLQPTSVAMARQALRRFGEAMRPRLVSAVDRRMVEAYRVRRRAEVGHETVRKDIRLLSPAFSWAVRVEMVPMNPFAGVRFGRRERRDPDALTAAHTGRLLALIETEPPWVQAALRLAVLWGPRAGELGGILREDLDLAARSLRIPARAGRRTPKTGRGRTVPVDETTAGLLQELSHREGPLLWGAGDGAFRSLRGFLGGLRSRARSLLAAVGARPQDDHPLQFLRRSAETNMRRRGVPDWMIGRILGHGTRVGEQWYAGMGPEEIARQVEALMRARVPPGSPSGGSASAGEGPACP